ncbi:MAG: hypothetical protein U9O98_03370, partial [Asgard group archaeon]|nr:hypothetical protein [Asgard group archaeon]
GDWTNTYPLWNGFFCMGTLRIIGLSMIINSILLYFLLRKNGYEKFTRNIIILGILAIFVIVSTEFVNSWVDNLDWIIPENLPPGVELGENVGWPNNHIQALNASFKSWFCTIISGNTEPLFPFLGTAFIGAILGICLAQPEKIKHLNLIGGLTGLFFLISGIGFVFLGYFSFGNSRPPIGNYLVMLGGQLCVFFILLRLVEYRGKAQEFGNHPLVKHFRLWGMLSLTLFVLDLLDILPRMLFGLGYNVIFSVQLNMIPGNVFGMGQEYLAIIYAIFSIIFYEGIIYLWSRIDFFLSFEWIIIHFVGVITNKFSKRLDVQKMMNEVTWINYDKVSKYDTGEKNLAVKS